MELKRNKDWRTTIFAMLLIVPYGIETKIWLSHNGKRTAFNCTLWN